MSKKWKKWLSSASFVFLAFANFTQAHGPIFGTGPHTIYKDGVGIELKYEREQEQDGNEQALHLHATYGLTADWAVALEVPQVKKVEEDQQASGTGDVMLQTKWRFYRKDFAEGRQDQIALLAAVKLPTGDTESEPSLGSGSTDIIAGLTLGRESRTLYYFADLRYRLNGENEKYLKKGNAWLYGASFGFRPWLNEYWEQDTVFLLELFGKQQEKAVLNNQELENTGGHSTFMGPSFLWSYQNWMITGGVSFPVQQNLNGEQEKQQYQFALGIEQHL
ncbi:MAG: hypothetical protein H8E38_08605 [SAR324 cluster bacterium]|nr:hypothetical protein [SAR324 cluster bacterium]